MPFVDPATSTRTARPAPAPGGPARPLVSYLRHHRWARRGVSALSVGLLVAAVGLLGYPFYTNLYQSRVQSNLRHQLASPELRQAYQHRSLRVGDSLTRIKIPKIGVDVVVVEGTSASALKAGAGHYPETPLPCESGNVAIAGHRTTYGKPFANIDRLGPGDLIVLETPVGACTYEVSRDPFVVPADERSVVASTPGHASLTLTSCHPKGSASHRIVVSADMKGTAVSA
ncbi:MAG: class E sortase [Actinobacteria bacterium]|nr:MAG: class E sortase [Actinomycetota bacterium]